MNYKLLNEEQRNKMIKLTKPEYIMENKNPDFIDYLMGNLPNVKRFSGDDKAEIEILSLQKMLEGYDSFLSDKEDFIRKIVKKKQKIESIIGNWNGISINEIQHYTNLHTSCLIYGEAGIGKSFFIKSFEDKLVKNDIEHLCIYGKFEKDTENIDVQEIIESSSQGFVFIVDAVNEMSEVGQKNLLEVLSELKTHEKIRIVITYRSNSLNEDILSQYRKILKYEHEYEGVSFRSALNEILKMPVANVYLYEDILYSNNALLLGMLCKILKNGKLNDKNKKGISSITFILEQYIKKTINNYLDANSKYHGIDFWKDTKKLAAWMYDNECKIIDEEALLRIINNGYYFTELMVQTGFLSYFEYETLKYYYFTIDLLSDFLIARSLFDDINKKDTGEQINIINSKLKKLNSLKEAFIIIIFDKFSPNYDKIKTILIETNLIKGFDYSLLPKINFSGGNIKEFMNIFSSEPFLLDHNALIKDVGGYNNTPFNCSNYLFKYYSERQDKLKNLSKNLSGKYYKNKIIDRLKNILYFITLTPKEVRKDDEAFYFGLLCCAAPNSQIKYLAMKIVYEISIYDGKYIDSLIESYYKIKDFYIKESIIFILSKMEKSNNKIMGFFKTIVSEEEHLMSESIHAVSSYFNKPYSFINWERKNLFVDFSDSLISEFLNKILFNVTYFDKNFLPFSYYTRNEIKMPWNFIINEKEKINIINDNLKEKYFSIKEEYINNPIDLRNIIIDEINKNEEIERMDTVSFLKSFENVVKYVFDFYGLSKESDAVITECNDFENSFFKKIIDISKQLYYGSLMCNFFTDNISVDDNQYIIGLNVYDPLDYERSFSITSPIPVYNPFLEKLNNTAIESLKTPVIQACDRNKTLELFRTNIIHLIEPIICKDEEWVLLSCFLNLIDSNIDREKTLLKDTYSLYCCTSNIETIYADGNARKLTIDLENFDDNINEYINNKNKSWLCKKIPCISDYLKIFEHTNLVLPPSDIINYFDLDLNVKDFSWESKSGEKVIICNNMEADYYKDIISETVFIRKSYYDKFIKKANIKYFSFVERYDGESGYMKDYSLHFEIENGEIIKEIKNFI